MTEEEWLEGTHPAPMLEYLDGKATERKARLFCCACCRRIWDLLPDEGLRSAVEITEDFPNDGAKREEAVSSVESVLAAVLIDLDDASTEAVQLTVLQLPERQGDIDFAFSAAHKSYDAVGSKSELTGQRDLLRDIFGNPFRPVAINPAWLAWNDGTVRKIAQAIYDERAFDRMPILADALEDAGCDLADILHHCRSAGPHVRGCWVVDLLLGKS